jgi:hypothetical protein
MTNVIVHTRGGPLTDDDFESEAPVPGSSDHKYDDDSKDKFQAILARVKQQVEDL